MLLSPETPAHLLATGRKAEAEETAKKLWGPSYRSQLYTEDEETANAAGALSWCACNAMRKQNDKPN
jgi:hypothetical protein